MRNSCFWVLGRGASIANGLDWAVPGDWYAGVTDATRDEVIQRIKICLRNEMGKSTVHRNAYRRLIQELSGRTSNGWYNRFITTNWDTLLETELNSYVTVHGAVQRWLGNQSHVYHLNGTIEEVPEGVDDLHSPFLLEIDPPEKRIATVEGNYGFNKLIWSNRVVMIGLSFACPTDQNFLNALNRVEDEVPIGEAAVYIVNPRRAALEEVCQRVNTSLPASTIVAIEEGFDTFIEGGLSELVGTVLE